jgi:hypothetical protein
MVSAPAARYTVPMLFRFLPLPVLAAAPRPAAAQAQPRLLEVPASAAWQLEASGMILPARVAGLGRGSGLSVTAGPKE